GTPYSASATRLMLLGSGELGREVAIEAVRLGLEVIAVDRYAGAPAMQVAQHSRVVSMLDGRALRALIEKERPAYIVPEIEAVATETLEELEREGFNVTPSARAVRLTMNREGIRRLAAEELGLLTSPYRFAGDFTEFTEAVHAVGMPCVVKPVMSSSGKGQSVLRVPAGLEQAWQYAQEGARGGRGRVIIEGFIDFDYEITLLTVRHAAGTTFCEPIGHYQEDGDYRSSRQPQPMSPEALAAARETAERVTSALGGRGIFGVELFVKKARDGAKDTVYFSEVSPRPHDTGFVTCISQNLSEFALHVRALLGLPVPAVRCCGPAASAVILPHGHSNKPVYCDLDTALREPDTTLMLFGKPEIAGRRRMGVALALGASLEEAVAKAQKAADAVQVAM
ncbi:MAG: formate-dependent phosphoribosylglycinamide formyltransferase, partial [Desulfovibrio sp.]|nr:formate-dependent phosphoribosylglycinamide formyltransferase [Desulfovibrio sp.]